MTFLEIFKDLAAVHKGENGNARQENKPHTAKIAKSVEKVVFLRKILQKFVPFLAYISHLHLQSFLINSVSLARDPDLE